MSLSLSMLSRVVSDPVINKPFSLVSVQRQLRLGKDGRHRQVRASLTSSPPSHVLKVSTPALIPSTAHRPNLLHCWLLILEFFFLTLCQTIVFNKVSCTAAWSWVSCFSAGKRVKKKKKRNPRPCVRAAAAL